MIVCPTCALENTDTAPQCARCGRPLSDLAERSLRGKTNPLSPVLRVGLSDDADDLTDAPSVDDAEDDSDDGAEDDDAPLATSRNTPTDPEGEDSIGGLRIPISSALMARGGLKLGALSADDDDDDAIALTNPLRDQAPVQDDTTSRHRNTLIEGLPAVTAPLAEDPPLEQRRALRMTEPLAALTPPSDDGDPPTLDEPEDDPEPSPRSERDSSMPDPRATLARLSVPASTVDTETNRAVTSSDAPPAVPPPTTHHAPSFFLGVMLGMLAAGAVVGLISAVSDPKPDGATPSDDPSAQAEDLPPTVTVAAGPYLRGLSNDYRLMFAETCKKIAEEPDTECKEDIALKGEYPQVSVDVPAFAIDTGEVTNAQWDACVAAETCAPIDHSACDNHTLRGLQTFQRVPMVLKEAAHPVVCVTRDQAQAYCAWKGGALPTPDQWEKAARGEQAYLFPWGGNWESAFANWAERDMLRTAITGQLDGVIETARPGRYPKGRSPYGVMDMAGNVAEWTLPEEGDDALRAHARGGSWLSNPIELRTTYRLVIKPDARRTDVGFRCVYPAEAAAPAAP